MIPNNQIWWGSGSGGVPVEIGNLFNYENEGFNSSNFDAKVGLGTYTLNETTLDISGVIGTFDSYITSKYCTASENSFFEVEYTVNTVNGTSYGLGIGLRGQNPNQSSLFNMYLVCSSGGLLGKILMESNFTTAQSATAIPIAVNDLLKVRFERTPLGYTITAYNLTQGGSVSMTESAVSTAYPITGLIPNNTSKWALYSVGGDYTINKYSYSTTEFKLSDVMQIADSKGRYCSTTQGNATKNLLVTDGYDAVLNWGSGDKTAEVVLRLPEILLYNPRKAFIDVGCNDIRNGVSSATWQANFQTIYTTLNNVGISVYFLTPTCEGPIDTKPIKTYLEANFLNVIDVFTPTWLGGANNNYDPTYIVADGIHLTNAGMALKKTLIEAVL